MVGAGDVREKAAWFVAGALAGGLALAALKKVAGAGQTQPQRQQHAGEGAKQRGTSQEKAQAGEQGGQELNEEPMFVSTLSASKNISVGRHAHRAEQPDDPLVVSEQFSRNRMFFGEEKQKQLEKSFVIVVGLGGVGSHAAHMLARAGIGRLRLIDFDNVTLSSLNRHAVATRDDVGRPKVVACAEHFADIVPTCEVDARVEMFTADMADELLAGGPCYVVDAIDDVNTKVDLLLACSRLGLTVISALGAGAKSDPTRLLIGDITDPSRDPLAAKLRWALRSRVVDKQAPDEENARRYRAAVEHIRMIYSSEEPSAKLAALTPEQMQNPDAYGAVPNFRIRILPVLGTMPALVGIGTAAHVLCELAGKPFSPRKIEAVSHGFAHKTHNRLVRHEGKEFGNRGTSEDALPMADQMEVTYLLEEVWRMRSAYAFDRNRATTRNLMFTRFDRSKPAQPYNLVLLTDQELRWHDRETAVTGTVPAMLLQGCESGDVDYTAYPNAAAVLEQGQQKSGSGKRDKKRRGKEGGGAAAAENGTSGEEERAKEAQANAQSETSELQEEGKQAPAHEKQRKTLHPSFTRGAPALATLRKVHAQLLAMEKDWTASA